MGGNKRVYRLGTMKVAAVINSLYVLAGVALFATGEAPVITPGVDFLGDKFAMAWAGWKFSGCLYMALVNWNVGLGLASAVAMIPYIGFDYFAIQDPTHWTPLCWSFIALECITLVTALNGNLKVGGIINPGVDFLGDKFAMAWAGWKFSGCL